MPMLGGWSTTFASLVSIGSKREYDIRRSAEEAMVSSRRAEG
jgi:hypothetical protein